jgi:signal transduction histidine kinase
MGAEPTSGNGSQPAGFSSLFLAITQHAPLPMAMVEGVGHIVSQVNPAFCRLMDKPMEQLVGKPFHKLLPEKDECVAMLDRVFRTRKPETHVEQEHFKPHPVFWSYTMWVVLADKHRAGVMIQVTETAKLHAQTVAMNEALMLGSLRQHEFTEASENLNAQLRVEITERKQAEEALQRAQAQLVDRAGHLEHVVAERTEELTATNKQLEAFTYTIAHDLGAPLRSMLGFSTILIEDAGMGLSETGRGFAKRINASARFMAALLQDLLAFSRIAQQQIELASVDLETSVQSVFSRLENEIREKNGRVESSGPWPAVLAHEPMLGQVLTNLVSNALKFVRPGVPPLVRVRAEEQGEFIRVWVEDSGIGIAPAHQKQIFGLFTRLGGEAYQGTGIGLAIVEHAVKRMGGRVGVESTPGQGSRFWFELPKA